MENNEEGRDERSEGTNNILPIIEEKKKRKGK